MNTMLFRDRDGIVHIFDWGPAEPAFSRCRQWAFGSDPSRATVERSVALNLVVSCLGCIGAVEDP